MQAVDAPESDYFWQRKFRDLWETAAQLYESGRRDPTSFFSKSDLDWLEGIGCSAQELYDFVEDWCDGGEPDYGTALLITAVRREYFLTILNGKPASAHAPEETLPLRRQELGGIAWLPRLVEKAKRKLSGTLCDDVMYCCGGDRHFLGRHGIHPADFLRVVWAHWNDEAEILRYVRGSKERLPHHSSPKGSDGG